MTTDTRWTDIDKMLQPAPKGREELHMRAVQDIAHLLHRLFEICEVLIRYFRVRG